VTWGLLKLSINFHKQTLILKQKRWTYLLTNPKHLVCLESVILGLWVSCLFAWLVMESFSIALINLRKYLMYSGKVSRLQWPPPLTHKGSYFSFESSHNRFPWEQSTISSSVPCKQSISRNKTIISVKKIHVSCDAFCRL